MILNTVYARFYKSFNFDHHRKAHRNAKSKPWEMIDDKWYPYIEVPIDSKITTIVGANESGKSHLLDAIKKAVTGDGFKHQDLCRYCDFFNVERGNEFWPHLGIAWSEVGSDDVAKIRKEAPDAPEKFTSFLMFREGPDRLNLYFPSTKGQYQEVNLLNEDARKFGSTYLPRVFTIESKAALPAALPTSELVEADGGAPKNRATRTSWMAIADVLFSKWTGNAQAFASSLPQAAPELGKILNDVHSQGDLSNEQIKQSYNLARKLLLQLANIDPERLTELAQYIEAGENGHATALAESINQQLEKRLNFPKYWVQDRDFQLRITALESELVFTVRDRTGTQYTFDERSAGLKYFLSYFIQAQTHVPDPNRREILVMDEPDAYLSAEAQQDLLKIFKSFAEPDGDARPIQVAYVTHSPFLLDKNHAERIRVLQKGKGEDGTRVIKNASQNHYEPLRSAFGAYVGETAFIGACNLLVEGVADQVLLAGVSRVIQKRGTASETEILDLNRIVMVPCGSANHVPYMLYLIRGRDSDSPSTVILLDSDKSGNDAAKILKKDDKKSRRLINPDYVTQFGDYGFEINDAHQVQEPEDLLSASLAVVAVNKYFAEIAEFREGEPVSFSEAEVLENLDNETGIYDALKKVAELKGTHVDKLGLARAVVSVCEKAPQSGPVQKDVDKFLCKMKVLFKGLNRKVRAANEEKLRHRVKTMVEQQRKIFVQDHPETASREQGLFLFERISDGLDNSLDAKAVRDEMRALTAEFGLDGQANDAISNFDNFLTKLRVLKDAYASQKLEEPREISNKTTKAKMPNSVAAKRRAKPPQKKS